MIPNIHGENGFRYLTAGDKNHKILLIIRIIRKLEHTILKGIFGRETTPMFPLYIEFI
jgi:hypothetical protein